MKTSDFVLFTLEAFGGEIIGKTLLQKRIYFESILTDMDLGYRSWYYGPYSSEVEDALGRLIALDFVDESVFSYGIYSAEGFEIKQFGFHLTKEGEELVTIKKERLPRAWKKIGEAAKKIKNAGDPDYNTLSVAAKAYYILKGERTPLTSYEIKKTAQGFNWDFGQTQLDKAVKFLENLGLIKEIPTESYAR